MQRKMNKIKRQLNYNRLLKRELKYRNILVHHSSIDRIKREENENKFNDLKGKSIIFII